MALGAVADRLERLHVPRALGTFLTLGAVVGGLVLVGMLRRSNVPVCSAAREPVSLVGNRG